MYQLMKQRLKQFTANTDGNVAVLFGLSAIPLLVAAGSAIDYARYSEVRQQTTVALDAGILSAVASLNDDEDITEADITKAKAIGLEQFKATLGTNIGATINDPVFTRTTEGDGFTATVTGAVDTNFLTFVGVNDLDMNIESQGVYGQSGVVGSDVEIAMMLDVTGSMCDGSNSPCSSGRKLDAMKSAANLLVDKVVWADQSKNTSKIALIPFSSRVRLAADGAANAMFTSMTELTTKWSGFIEGTETQAVPVQVCVVWNYGWVKRGRNWYWEATTCAQSQTQMQNQTVTTGVWQQDYAKAKPCVTERYYNSSASYDLTDDAPGPGKWINGDSGTRRLESLDSTDTDITQNGKTKPNYVRTSNLSHITGSSSGNFNTAGSCNGAMRNPNILMPLTNDTTALKARINGLEANGGTSGALGTAFAWYTISPKWASIWGTASAPQSYSMTEELNEGGKPKLFKIAVLMTDGEYNNSRGASATTSTVNAAALALCQGMKDQNIEVYTIGFETNSTADALLTSCATDASHFYPAGDEEALEQAFEDIGERVLSAAGQVVRLTK
jgi:Flp pilus assembly protein TadG